MPLFENLSLKRVIIHEVFPVGNNGHKSPPNYGTKLITLPDDAREAFHERIVTALGSQSQCMEMKIDDSSNGSCFSLCINLITASDDEFIIKSKSIIDKLSSAQTSRTIPGGIVLVFEGTICDGLSIVGIIKAEIHTGFTRQQKNGNMILEFLRELILTPQTKLYKIGVFIKTNKAAIGSGTTIDGWSVYVYDSYMLSSDRNAAAQYFYKQFLGCTYPQNDAIQTKQFYELTKKFIQEQNIHEDEKYDLLTGLYTYLKVDQSKTIELKTFSDSYFNLPEMKDSYSAFMRKKEFPEVSVHKDLTNLKHTLRRRHITFGNDIKLIAPHERFKESIQLETIQGAESGESAKNWTRITIKESISDQG